jgi:hypothetical protein
MPLSTFMGTLATHAVDRGVAYAKAVGTAKAGRVALRVAMSQPLLTAVGAAAVGLWFLRKHHKGSEAAHTAAGADASNTAVPST